MRFHSTARPQGLVPWARAFPEACPLRTLPSSGEPAPAPTFRGRARRVPVRSLTRIPDRVRIQALRVAAWAKLPAAIPVWAPAPRPPLCRVPAAAERSIPRPAAVPCAERRSPQPAAYSARLQHLLVKRAPLWKFPPAGWSILRDRRRPWAAQFGVSRCLRSGPPGSRAAATHLESAPGSHLRAPSRAAPPLPRWMEQRLSERPMHLLPCVRAPSFLPASKPIRKRGRLLRTRRQAARQPLPAPTRLSQFRVRVPALQQRHLGRPGWLARAGQLLPRTAPRPLRRGTLPSLPPKLRYPPLRRVRSQQVAAWLLPQQRRSPHPSNRPRAGTCVAARQSVRCCARRRVRHGCVRVVRRAPRCAGRRRPPARNPAVFRGWACASAHAARLLRAVRWPFASARSWQKDR